MNLVFFFVLLLQFLCLSHFLYLSLCLILLWHFLRQKPPTPLSQYPGVSLIVPIKGPVTHLKENLKSLLHQEYPGPTELIVTIEEKTDPSLPLVEKFIQEIPSATPVHLLVGHGRRGLNPKNSNVYHGVQKAQYPWCYFSDIDTRIEPTFLKKAIETVKDDPSHFATAISVHHSPQTLSDQIEGMGTNLEFVNYFLVMNLKKRPPILNGGSYLVHQELLEKVGGYEISLDRLTEDLLFANEFTKKGAKGHLVPALARVQMDGETFSSFWKRYVRWLLIVRSFKPELFYLAPFHWAGQWALVAALITGQASLGLLGLAVLSLRVAFLFMIQTLTGSPRKDLRALIALVAFDLLTPAMWFKALITTKVAWGRVQMKVKAGGRLF